MCSACRPTAQQVKPPQHNLFPLQTPSRSTEGKSKQNLSLTHTHTPNTRCSSRFYEQNSLYGSVRSTGKNIGTLPFGKKARFIFPEETETWRLFLVFPFLSFFSEYFNIIDSLKQTVFLIREISTDARLVSVADRRKQIRSWFELDFKNLFAISFYFLRRLQETKHKIINPTSRLLFLNEHLFL